MSFRLFLDLLTGRKSRPQFGPNAYSREEELTLLAIGVITIATCLAARQLGWFKTEKVESLSRDKPERPDDEPR